MADLSFSLLALAAIPLNQVEVILLLLLLLSIIIIIIFNYQLLPVISEAEYHLPATIQNFGAPAFIDHTKDEVGDCIVGRPSIFFNIL